MFFLSGFGALWVPLGSLLGLFEAVLGGLGPQKPKKHNVFFEVFAHVGFGVFEALNGSLGLILAPSWADLAPKWPPKLPKKNPNTCPKNDPPIREN